jgi:hypothetical protein
VPRQMFQEILRLIARLRAPPAPAHEGAAIRMGPTNSGGVRLADRARISLPVKPTRPTIASITRPFGECRFRQAKGSSSAVRSHSRLFLTDVTEACDVVHVRLVPAAV